MMASVAKTTDVVVIGFGFAGGAAAIAAADAGARVLLIEKAPQPGGISVCSAGGLRVADDADAAFAYLDATCGGKTPEPVLRRLAEGMVALPAEIEMLAKKHGATVARRRAGGNYPLPGFDTFGFVTVEDVPGFDPTAFSHVRGSPAGMRLFKLLAEAVAARRERITVATGRGASRLERGSNDVDAVLLENGERIAARAGIVLACGGFEADTNMQAQYWPGGPALNAAYRHNTGDGIRMAQAVGADLWHMWHYHGAYGFPSPDPAYPYGVRVKRLPDWRPGDGGDVPGMTLDPRRPARPALHERIRALHAGYGLAPLRRLRSGEAGPRSPSGLSPHRRGRVDALSARQTDAERSRRRLRMERRQS